MTQEQINLAIAEECPHLVEWHDSLPYWKGSWSAVGEGHEYQALFDPFNDLNACHEMEKALTETEKSLYADEIYTVTPPQSYEYRFLFATAQQRCEAFLRVKGKWTE